MTASTVRADYDALTQIANSIGREADTTRLEHAIERGRSKADGSGSSATTRAARKNSKPPRRG